MGIDVDESNGMPSRALELSIVVQEASEADADSLSRLNGGFEKPRMGIKRILLKHKP